ncbi:MAG TPA: cupin domain-containing protein [Thermoanaerobaculia bacterium]|nr:cupin domain-containing protein [Thermoanaerobaculia bacterium]
MDAKFNGVAATPENEIFKVVFFPDRIYHAQYLNATRSPRYRYNVMEVRGYADIVILKGEVYFDGLFYSNFLRIEYRASRLVEQVREANRFIGAEVVSWVRLTAADEKQHAEATVRLHYDAWIHAYQTEIWETLEAPNNNFHDLSELDMMGRNGSITRARKLNPLLRDIKGIKTIEIAFSEAETTPLSGHTIPLEGPEELIWDNNYARTHQEPVEPNAPSSNKNTIFDENYRLDFQRGYHKHTDDVVPVKYLNALMEPANPDYDTTGQNVVEMKWMLQRELGSSLVFFHEVTIPPGKTEGTHQHIGSEELYFITQGEGIAYMRVGDDPDIDSQFPTESRHVFGIGFKDFKAIPVRPGSMIYTKSGGMHGIRNTKNNPGDPALKFVAFLYHSS